MGVQGRPPDRSRPVGSRVPGARTETDAGGAAAATRPGRRAPAPPPAATPTAPRKLTVLYDGGCALCCRARRWLDAQPKYVAVEFMGAGTDRARARFPFLDPEETLQDIAVVADDGGIYRGAKAWLMCLWATKKYRGWALRLATPAMLPSVRRFVDWVSRRRHGYLWRD